MFTVSQFRALLNDAGYTVKTVLPTDLPAASGGSDVLLAVPSIESLPYDTFEAIRVHVQAGGGLMASGGEPFRNPLFLAPDGRWLDAATYQQVVGSAPLSTPYFPPAIPTISPAKEQYVNSAGLHVPIARGRGLFSQSMWSGHYRVIGDLLAPAATMLLNESFYRCFVVWLPWPQLFEPYRTELVAALQTAPMHLSLYTAGADQIVWLPGESITGGATVVCGPNPPAQATLQWSIGGASGTTVQPAVLLSPSTGAYLQVRLNIGTLPNGDYTFHFRLMVGDQEVDRVDSPVRVLNPVLTRQPDQKIQIVNGAFTIGGQPVFLRGVNYWPRYVAGEDAGLFNGQSWLEAGQYDPDLVETDLTEIAALHFNLVNIQFSDFEGFWAQEGRALIDFLERCRNHGIWVQVALRATLTNAAYAGQVSDTLDSYLQAAFLPGNDRVLAYELFWEPMIGTHDKGGQGRLVDGALVYNTGRLALDADWRSWVNDQYGSLANAEQIWGITAPRDSSGQLTNPLDDQIANDGPWRIMVSAYRRFLDDYLGRNIGAIARQIRRTDPDVLLTYRNWTTMTDVHNSNTGYDIGTAAAHLDYLSPERYGPVLLWPDDRGYGFITAYSKYRSSGKPVFWAEYGADIGKNSGTPASRAAQAAICDTMMRQVADDGSNGASVWWWPGGYGPMDGTDFGIIDADGTPRACARTLDQWNVTFAATPPGLKPDPPTTITVDRDADARGAYGLLLNYQDAYVRARQAGQSVVLADQGTGTDTSTMPLVQVGNAAYAGTGPLKFANSEFGGIRVVCPNLDVTVENGSSVAIAPGAACQITPTLVNTGEARWLAAPAASRGVTLHTNLGDAPLGTAVTALQRTAMGPLTVTMGQSAVVLTGRLKVAGVGDFGEVLNLTLTADSTSSGACATSLNPAAPVSATADGGSGTINVTAPVGCSWAAAATEPWLTVAPTSGSGNGTVTYTVQGNYGPTRQTMITVARHPITVTQDGVTNAPLAQAPAISASSLSFGKQTVGTSGAAQSVKVTNSGSIAVNLLAVAIGGLNRADFSQTNTCGPVLAAGESCTVQVLFAPTAAGARTAALYVSGNIGTGPQAVALSGMGLGTGPVPAIQAVVDSWGYSAGIAPGLWVTIGGTNLAGAPQTWNLDGVQTLPVLLGGTSVTFNSAPAALLYVSGTQINALVPASVAAGKVDVVAQVNGVNSVPFSVTARAAQPAVYAPPSADGSTFFVTAALAGTATLVGNSATDPRVTRAANPGEAIDLYMIGLGATADPAQFVTDRVFSGAFPLSAAVSATVGGKTANVLFAGLTAPGLYLVRMVVPVDVAPGTQALVLSAGGVGTRGSLVLQVGTSLP
jgi:uncharacterized protein (TIGR03437 family)